eukprot:NODE_434_length_7483_cov_0.351165.p1 type:complete len:802 gc:universal NODE_434_length_7483_cov_0.351165:3050-645(-)
MYALLLSLLISVSIDCPVVVKLAQDLDMKYLYPEYTVQYDKDCCLGYGVVCENDRVIELHWDFIGEYGKPTNPSLVFPSNLRVLALLYCEKDFSITKLPETLKVLDLYYGYTIQIQMDVLPNITYLRTTNFNQPLTIKMPDSLEYLETPILTFDILPLNMTNLKELHNSYFSNLRIPLKRILPDTIEVLNLIYCKCDLTGFISQDFKNMRYLELHESIASGNLTITSPNITHLGLGTDTKFDRLFVKHPDRITACYTSEVYLEPDNAGDLTGLQARGCKFNFKNATVAPSPDCSNLILFYKQLNMHLASPDYFNYLAGISNCCDEKYHQISCTENRIVSIRFNGSGNLNGTFNTSLLPPLLNNIDLRFNQISSVFPDLSGLSRLSEIDFSLNHFSGGMKGKLPSNLLMLFIKSNEINGSMPLVNGLGYLAVAYNHLDSFENGWSAKSLFYIDVSYNQIKGVVDMTYFSQTPNLLFNFKHNFIDKILTLGQITNFGCDVSWNNIAANGLTNFTSCIHVNQRYTDPIKLKSCSDTKKLFQNIGIDYSNVDDNCCDSYYGGFSCTGQNVTEIRISNTAKTNNGYAFLISDLPFSLESLLIASIYNQTAKIPENIPGNIKLIQIFGSIGGPLPLFAEGLETLHVSSINLNQPWPVLPNSLKVLRLSFCNLTGPITSLPPNLEELQIQGNSLTGPFPTFPASLKIVVLGDFRDENNSFDDVLVLQSPMKVLLGKSNVYDLKINSTNLLADCDLSFSPLLNSTHISNYTMCKKYYLTTRSLNLQITSESPTLSTIPIMSSENPSKLL